MLWVSESFVVVTMRGVLVLLQHTLSGIMAGRSVWEWRGDLCGNGGEAFVGMAGGQRRNGRGEFCGDGGIHGCRSRSP